LRIAAPKFLFQSKVSCGASIKVELVFSLDGQPFRLPWVLEPAPARRLADDYQIFVIDRYKISREKI
jgi:hypothetical protein